MRRQTSIADQLYAHLFKRPSTTDPPSFAVHLNRNLVPEVRIEVATFYGDLNSVEARYPGLDYCNAPHRMRLSRFKHHRRLFDAFDALGLTDAEIRDFCCWEGTRWARERYERDAGVKVFDTTGDEIGPFVDRREVREGDDGRRGDITRKTEISVVVEDAGRRSTATEEEEEDDEVMSEEEEEEECHDHEAEEADEAEEDESGQTTPLQHRAYPALSRPMSDRERLEMARRINAAQEQGHGLSPEMEQFLKEERERESVVTAAPRAARAAA